MRLVWRVLLNRKQGVVDVSVNYANAKDFSWVYSEFELKWESLRKAVQSIDYDLLIDESTSGDETIEQIQKKTLNSQKKTYWALILSIPVVVIGMFFMNMPFANEIMWF